MSKIVCLDTNIVIWGLLKQGKAADEMKREKAVYLLTSLQQNRDRVLISAIALAEVVAKIENAKDKQTIISKLSENCEIIPFDIGSAEEFGVVRSVGIQAKSKSFSRKEISLDSLIVASCKKYKVDTLYTDDNHLAGIARNFMKVEGLPGIPPRPINFLSQP
ncbi:MAG: type II toxin-antitoxin system VapC family toxin [Desulfovibrio sp.]|jgi:predicted nucleic acid-binding protein|nr:type II toxin-antitoxin system VapC family toxin [Desulfovibrio sp.]